MFSGIERYKTKYAEKYTSSVSAETRIFKVNILELITNNTNLIGKFPVFFWCNEFFTYLSLFPHSEKDTIVNFKTWVTSMLQTINLYEFQNVHFLI